MSVLSRDEVRVLLAVKELLDSAETGNGITSYDLVAARLSMAEDRAGALLRLLVESGHLEAITVAEADWPLVTGRAGPGLRETLHHPNGLAGLAAAVPGAPEVVDGVTMRRTVGTPTWDTRDLPVLVEVVDLWDQTPNGYVSAPVVAERLGMSVFDVSMAMRALAATGYVVEGGDFEERAVEGVTQAAYRATRKHPDPNDLAERFLAVLGQTAESTQDEEDRRLLEKLDQDARALGVNLLGQLIGGVIRGAAGA